MEDLNADDKERFVKMMGGMSKEGQRAFLNVMEGLDAKQKVQMVGQIIKLQCVHGIHVGLLTGVLSALFLLFGIA
jgi:hypothetical protein